MTYKGWFRLLAGFFATAAIFGSLGLGIAYGLPDQSIAKNKLRTVVNGVNVNTWYRFDGSFSYGSIASNEPQRPLITPQLVRHSSRGENARVVDLSKPVGDDFNLNLKPSEHGFSQFWKLELASKVVLRQTNTNLVFDSDADDSQLKNSINSQFFRQSLASPATLAIDFVVRPNVPWVNHFGEPATSPSGQIYYVKALDWLYGAYRTGLTNNNWRHAPVDASNPFGGYGVLPKGQDQQKWSQRWSEQSRQASVIGRFRPLASTTGGFSNNYLYDIFGVKNLTELVTPLPGRSGAALLGSFEGQPTVSISAKEGVKKADFGQLFKKLLDSLEFIPAPSGYIQDYASKVSHVSGNGASLVVPDKSDPAVETSDINVRKYGIFTYGTDWSNTLYAGPYYVKNNNQFQVEFDLNTHYWNDDFVKSARSIKNIIFDYSPQSDNKIFAQSMFEQYRHGRVYSLELNDLASDKIFDIKKDPTKFGLRYVDSQIDNRFVSDIFPIALPLPGLSRYHFNDNFARLWFGSPLTDISAGKMELSQYLKPSAVAFRSQIMAAINWYTQNRTMSKLDQTEPWYPPLPPDAPVSGQTSESENPPTFYDYRDQLNTLTYYELGSDQISLVKNTVSMQENQTVYQSTSSLQDSLKSAAFEKIVPAIARTIKTVLGDDVQTKIEWTFTNRFVNIDANGTQMLQQFAEVLKMLNPQLEPSAEIYNNADVMRNYLLGQGTWYSFHNWSPDYAGAGTWLTGLSRERFGIHALALASLNSNLDQNTPTLTDYGQRLSERITSQVSEHFAARPDLADVFKDPSAVSLLSNAKEVSLSAHSLISDSLLDVSKYEKLSAPDRLLVDRARAQFQNTIAKLDFEVQQEVDDQYFVSIFNEYMSLVGNFFGTQEIGLPNKQKPIAKVWQPWLVGHSLKNGVIYLQDYEVI